MKKLLYVFILMIPFWGCTDLEPEIYSDINPGIFPKNESDAEAMVTDAVYSPFESGAWSGIFSTSAQGIQVMGDMTTDIGHCNWNDPEWNGVLIPDFTPYTKGVTQFYDYLRSISKMTSIIEKVEAIDMDQAKKDRLLAEIHCGRGWMAYLLYDWFGPIPVATAEQLDDPMSEEILPRPTQEWMVEYIETELKAAIAVLPAVYEAGDANYGRFTRGLAYTVLMKLYMHESRWKDAVTCGRELMKAEYGYALEQDYKAVFTLENEKNKEIIYACQEQRGVVQGMWHAHVMPSQYPTANPNIQKWNGYRVPWPFYHSFEAGDKRLEVLVGKFVGTDGKTYSETQNAEAIGLNLGALPIKYGEDPNQTSEYSDVDWIVYRYADVLTLLAEAIVREGNSVTQEALDLLNGVRERAGLDGYEMADVNGVEDFLEKVLLERGHELWFEGCRRSDLIRHGKYVEIMRAKGSRTAAAHFNVMPLPQKAINAGKGVVLQNPQY